jgi:DNA-binding NarL/FixJ family response regulator
MSDPQNLSGRLRVLIIDPHEISRAAVRALLQTEGVDVVADVASVEQALTVGDRLYPDVVVLDLADGGGASSAARRALGAVASCPVLVLTSSKASGASVNGEPFVAKSDVCERELRRAMERTRASGWMLDRKPKTKPRSER